MEEASSLEQLVEKIMAKDFLHRYSDPYQEYFQREDTRSRRVSKEMLTFGYDVEATGTDPFENKVITIQYRRNNQNHIFKIGITTIRRKNYCLDPLGVDSGYYQK